MYRNKVKISLIALLILCLFDMPYWYYQLFRIFGTIGFVYLAYVEYSLKLKLTPQIFVAMAIIINPIIKILFDRDTWQIVDIILVVIVFISFFHAYIKKLPIKF